MAGYLREILNKPKTSILLVPPKRVSVRREHGRNQCDVVVDRDIGIELKNDLKEQKEVDRTVGQIKRFKKDYKDIIILLVGKTNKEKLEALKDEIDDLRGNYMMIGFTKEPRIKIIDKGSKK